MSTSLESFMGGGRAFAPMTVDVTVKAGWPRLLTLDPDASGRKVVLPDARTLKRGSPQLILLCIDAVLSVEVEDAAGGTVIAALGPEEGAILGLQDNSTLAGTWVTRVEAI